MSTTNRDVTAFGRLSYPNLFTPRAVTPDSDKKQYSCTLLIPKTDTDTIARVQAAIQTAVQDGVERGTFKQPIDPAHTKYPPLRDGDLPNANGEPRGPEYAGHWFISAKANETRKPFVVDGQLQPIIDESEIYAGCYVNVALRFYAYSHDTGGKGISTSVTGVQKAKDGEPLGDGKVEAADVFGVINTPPAAAPAAAQGGFTPAAPNTGLGF